MHSCHLAAISWWSPTGASYAQTAANDSGKNDLFLFTVYRAFSFQYVQYIKNKFMVAEAKERLVRGPAVARCRIHGPPPLCRHTFKGHHQGPPPDANDSDDDDIFDAALGTVALFSFSQFVFDCCFAEMLHSAQTEVYDSAPLMSVDVCENVRCDGGSTGKERGNSRHRSWLLARIDHVVFICLEHDIKRNVQQSVCFAESVVTTGIFNVNSRPSLQAGNGQRRKKSRAAENAQKSETEIQLNENNRQPNVFVHFYFCSCVVCCL